jgi:hypothetical protein
MIAMKDADKNYIWFPNTSAKEVAFPLFPWNERL